MGEPPSAARPDDPPAGEVAPAAPPAGRAIALRVVATLVVALLVVVAARRIDLHALGKALEGASLAPLAFGAVLSLAMIATKAGYWKTIVSPFARVPFRVMLWYGIASAGASLVLPMRGGEAVRVFGLRKQYGVPLKVVAAAFAVEKLLDVCSLVVILSPLPWLLPSQPWLTHFQPIAFSLLALIVGAFVLARRSRKRFPWLAGLQVFDDAAGTGVVLVTVLAAWVMDALLIMLTMSAVGIAPTFGAALLVLFAGNLAIAIPAAPGNIGSLELAVGYALTRMHVPEERAAAFAIAYHGVQLVTLLLVWSLGAVFALGRPGATERPEIGPGPST